MRIAFFEIENWEKDFLAERLKGHDLSFHEETLTPETASMAAGADAVAVIGDLLIAGDPRARVRAYLARLARSGHV